MHVLHWCPSLCEPQGLVARMRGSLAEKSVGTGDIVADRSDEEAGREGRHGPPAEHCLSADNAVAPPDVLAAATAIGTQYAGAALAGDRPVLRKPPLLRSTWRSSVRPKPSADGSSARRQA